MHWIDQPQNLAAYHAKLPADWRVQLKRAFEASAFCRRFGSGRLAAAGIRHSPPSVSPMQEIGPEAEAAINDVYAAIDASSTPSELASALGPILDLTYGMGETDAAVVQAVISVAQNSFEEYYADNYATIAGAEAEIEADLDDCFQGQMENQTYEADGITSMHWGELTEPSPASPVGRRGSLRVQSRQLRVGPGWLWSAWPPRPSLASTRADPQSKRCNGGCLAGAIASGERYRWRWIRTEG